MKIQRVIPRSAAVAGVVAAVVVVSTLATATTSSSVALPLSCNKGPDGQRFTVQVTAPASVEEGGTYTIRLDGASSGKISHFGLNYLHDMTVEYTLPTGTSYVEGSAAFVPGTGFANVLSSPRVGQKDGVVTMTLPDRVANGTSYTPPSISFQVRATGNPGSAAVLGFKRFQLRVNALVVGDVAVSCAPTTGPYPIGSTKIIGAAQ